MPAAATDVLADHRAAVASCMTTAAAVPDARWTVPRGEGKWTPAQEVEHLALAYEAFTRDLSGGTPLKTIGKRWQRLLWRTMAMRRILRSGRFHRAVPAPREIRPVGGAPRPESIARLESAVALFERTFEQAWANEPGRLVTHPYFGGLSLRDAARFVAVHTQHHTRFLQASLAG